MKDTEKLDPVDPLEQIIYNEGYVEGDKHGYERGYEDAEIEWLEHLNAEIAAAWRELAPPLDRFCDWRNAGEGIWLRLADMIPKNRDEL